MPTIKVKNKQGSWVEIPIVAKMPAEIPVVDHGTSNTTLAIDCNKYHLWGEVASLNITLTPPTKDNIVCEYMFQFTSGTQPTTLSLPQDIKWIGDNKIEASKTYQVSIVNNIAIMGGV